MPGTKLRTVRKGPIRKLRVAGIGALVPLVVVVANLALGKLGQAPLTAADGEVIVSGAEALFYAAGALVTWLTAYRARPAPQDRPVEVPA